MPAAIYVRVSTSEQAEGGVSLDQQEHDCREALHRLDIPDSDIVLFRDEGHTATNTNRPAYQRLMATLDEWDIICCWNLDRLWRDDIEQNIIIQRELAPRDIALLSVTQQVDIQSAEGLFVAGMNGLLNVLEVRKLRRRVKAATEHRARQGLHLGRATYGYEFPRGPDGTPLKGALMEIVEAEAAIVRRLFGAYVRGGSIIGLAQTGNAEGWPLKRGGAMWRSRNVRLILTNPTYTGMIVYNDQVLPGKHEPIIGVQLWEAVQQRMAERGRIHPRSVDTTLGSLFRCGVCGGAVRQLRRDTPGRQGRYGCAGQAHLPVAERHAPVSGGKKKLEAIVWEYTEYLFTGEALARGVRQYRKERRAATRDTERGDIEERLATAEQQIRLNIQYATAHLIPADMFDEQQRPLIRDREELQAQLEAIAEPHDLKPRDLRWLRDAGAAGLSALRASDYSHQQEALRAFDSPRWASAYVGFSDATRTQDAAGTGVLRHGLTPTYIEVFSGGSLSSPIFLWFCFGNRFTSRRRWGIL